jgi:hypothetical protein
MTATTTPTAARHFTAAREMMRKATVEYRDPELRSYSHHPAVSRHPQRGIYIECAGLYFSDAWRDVEWAASNAYHNLRREGKTDTVLLAAALSAREKARICRAVFTSAANRELAQQIRNRREPRDRRFLP